jgi:hypothetical protein
MTDAGLIAGNASDAGGTFEPHYDQITQPDEVQTYESILGTPAKADDRPPPSDAVSQDNRLLPGFDKTAPAEIKVFGGASADFTGDGDRVRALSRGHWSGDGGSGASIPTDQYGRRIWHHTRTRARRFVGLIIRSRYSSVAVARRRERPS